MRIRRQFLAASLVLVAALAVPPRALPAAQPSLAEAHFATLSSSAPTAPGDIFLPYFTQGAIFDLAVSRVEVIQGMTMGDSYTVHIAGRPALLRVFATLSGGSSLPGISARLRRFVGGIEQNQLTVGPQTVNATTNEGTLSHTFNFDLPAGWLTAGSSYVVELDSANAVGETNENNNRYPPAGTQSFNAADMAPLNVVIVPVSYEGTLPPTTNLSYLTWMPIKVFPASQINYAVRSTPHTFTGDLTTGGGWSALLSQIDTIHASENPAGDKLYYGVVDSVLADGCSGGCIAGIGYISFSGWLSLTSAGFAGFPSNRNEASPTFTHEMGHNFGRRHAPCGGPSGVDGGYPYSGASIGQWGLDTATVQLYNPGTTRDYMSYCGPEWTSDYTYYGIAQAWGWLNAAASAAFGASGEPALLISGYIEPGGAVRVDPVFPVDGMPASATPSDNRLELLDAGGSVLAVVPFELTEVIIESAEHEEHAARFRVVLPPMTGLAGLRLYRGAELIYERLASGAAPILASAPTAQTLAPNGNLHVGWRLASGPAAAHYRVRFSPDGGATWTLLVLDAPTSSIEVPAELLAGAKAPLLEVQASDGVRSDREMFPLHLP